jgi:hypothetical protein
MPPTPSYLTRSPLPALGMASLVLGVISLILSLLPVLGAPLGACGIVFGIIGVVAAYSVPGTYLRWAVAGLVTSILAVGVNLAIQGAPAAHGEVPKTRQPPQWQPTPSQPYVPPPGHPS